MEKFCPERCAKIKLQLEEAARYSGAIFTVEPLNYEFTIGITAAKPNGDKAAWIAGVVNRAPDTDDYAPATRPVEPAILAALEFAKMAN